MKWAQSNLLKLNDQKTDVVVFGTKHKLPVMKDIRITVGGSTLSPSSHVRNIGVIFDSMLTMTNHICTICRTAYMHLHNISRIRPLPYPRSHQITCARFHHVQVGLRKCASSWTSPRTLEEAPANTEHRCQDNYLHTTS